MDAGAKIYIAGHNGLAGSAIKQKMEENGYNNLIFRTSRELDLRVQEDVDSFFKEENPEYVIIAAARVGGINANNSFPADFISDNLKIQTNVIDAAYRNGTNKLLFLGSTCIYPRECPQPIKEEYLLTGPLEETNQWYAVAKIAGIKLCQAYRRQYGFNAVAVMPTNLYGPNDNFDLKTSHVLPALIRKFHEAKVDDSPEVTVWGSGKPRREFLYIEDFANAILFLLKHYDDEEIINVGVGEDITIADLATLIADVIGYKGSITYDPGMPDGTPRKLTDVSKLHSLGWQAGTSLRDGITKTYNWYQINL
ncbi:MAG: GDP-L-fucose synthase [Proteobacteria bacterium]|nr:GDP-L-fucose synthase [Pseudomonadota bacterium]